MELEGKYSELYRRLLPHIPADRLYTDPLHTLAYGTDASFYRLIPKIVVRTDNEQEVQLLVRQAAELDVPLTFRAAGTSLSGQAVGDSVLVLATDRWKDYQVLDEGLRIRLQPGVVGAKANRILAPYGRKIGPDPASINACMIGGIAANNASGMCCGTSQNSYKTIDSMRVVLADGTLLDTGDARSREGFKKSHGPFLEQLQSLGERTRANTALSERIARKFKVKNTMGYSLNALVDYSDPFDILSHLMIGSEGTLGFLSEITYHTVEEHAHKATALMVFPSIEETCQAVIILKQQPVAAVELMDRPGLRSIEDDPLSPSYIKGLPEGAAAILVEVRAKDVDALRAQVAQVLDSLQGLTPQLPLSFSEDPQVNAALWHIRKGMFPAIGGMRKIGTSVLIEDVTFPIERLAEAVLDLQALLQRFHYTEAVIYGHALDGNLHFVFTQDFSTPSEVQRYAEFMDAVADLVVGKYDGALKAEHGTGRNMAPFVEMEWGKEAYALMKEIKALFDPQGILNPEVILSDNPQLHLQHLKPLPQAHEVVDKCIECGFCESNCVSHDLTLSPRQRIAVYREISRLSTTGGQAPYEYLRQHYAYEGDHTCATDGLCALACPVKIDTGKFIKSLRAQQHTGLEKHLAMSMASHMGVVTSLGRGLLQIASSMRQLLGEQVASQVAETARKATAGNIPYWSPLLPRPTGNHWRQISIAPSTLKVVYFPSCINRTMGTSPQDGQMGGVIEQMMLLSKRAGYQVLLPQGLDRQCCGMPYASKGFGEAAHRAESDTLEALWEASEQGRYPIVCDMSPCTYHIKELAAQKGMQLLDATEFLLDHLAPKLTLKPLPEKALLFPVCSIKKMGLEGKLQALAARCCQEVVMAESNCCGFAGDRGMHYPELNAHGLQDLAQQAIGCGQGYSSSRTCEIGLAEHSGLDFQHIVYLVSRASE